MGKFYHLDKTNKLYQGQIIDLKKINDIKGGDAKVTELLQEHINNMFPYGISRHGDNYFASSNYIPYLHPTAELLLEYIRKAQYKDKPSRFESFFAVKDANQLIKLGELLKINLSNCSIWEVECIEYFKADMFLLDSMQSYLISGKSNLIASKLGSMYWEGKCISEIVKNDIPFWEFLLISPIKVVRKVDINTIIKSV